MTELWLNFTDEKGEAKRVLVEGEMFVIGRTPDNDLQIPLGNLSRQHAKIQRFADVFVISDCDSSNGTTLNEEKLEKPIALKDGDTLNLGGGIELGVEMISDKAKASNSVGDSGGSAEEDEEDEEEQNSSSSSQSAAASNGGSSIPTGLFIILPLFGFFILVVLGGGAFFIIRGNKEEVKKEKDFVYTNEKSTDPELPTNENNENSEKNETPTPISTSGNNSNSGNPTPKASEEIPPTPKPSGETEKIESSSASFLRRIATNDSKAFLTGKQISIVTGKINQFKGSTALAENIQNAKKEASKIEALALSKNLRPQFLAVAALAKLGNQRGDVVATVQGMLEVLDKLSIQLGSEFANDNLLVIAAYEQGVAGQNLAMRDLISRVTTQFPKVDTRTVRSIWFLHENAKKKGSEFEDSQFEFALRFLAIGIITQNPKDFNVQAEALNL